MADKIILWEIKIGSMWVEVTERTFVNTMRIWCDHMFMCNGLAYFFNKEGCIVGKMRLKEV